MRSEPTIPSSANHLAFADYETTLIKRSGRVRAHCSHVQTEHIVTIVLNDRSYLGITCSPDHVDELVAGRLFSEGIIRSRADIASLSLDEAGSQAVVTLAGAAPSPLGFEGPAVLETHGGIGPRFEDPFPRECKLVPVTPIPWDPAWVFAVADELVRDTPTHKATTGTHSCFLAREDRILCMREDIGRHNAFDKVLGFALMNGIDLSRCFIFTSGRIPVDMVSKAIRARVPLLASKAVTTSQTIALARRYNLTLICSAHSDSLEVYCDPQA